MIMLICFAVGFAIGAIGMRAIDAYEIERFRRISEDVIEQQRQRELRDIHPFEAYG